MDGAAPRRLDWERLNRRWGPWVSLGLGALTVAFVRRGLDFAPVAAGVLTLAWTLAALVGRWLQAPEPGPGPDPSGGPAPAADATRDPATVADAPPAAPAPLPPPHAAPWRRVARTLAGSVVVGLYQNVLFYLLPVWFASATWTSGNVAFPLLLGAMAAFSCFEYPYRAAVLRRPAVRAVWTSLVLFATLVPAATVVGAASPETYVASSAAIASLIASGALVSHRRLASRPGLVALLAGTVAGTLALTAATPWLPPVPFVAMNSGAGTAISNRELLGEAERFPAGTARVYGWFAVAAPAAFRQDVRFEWSRDGQPAGHAVESTVVGGRRGGFRTWAWQTHPGHGRWSVDLLTAGGQLIGRTRFDVE
jgi:hypothetical protein